LPVTIGSPANGLAVTDSQILTIDKAQIFAGTSSQFVKGDGTLDSTAYGTGSVTSVALTMPTAFSVANSPVTTAGTLAVTATGTTSQYIRGDGSLETFPALTGFVPYTGATADVNLGAFDLLAERGTFENNGSSNTLTVNHTSGSGYGIIVTKGGNNEALYVSKTSGSGNAMTVVGGRTSLVDLALSSVTNTAGDFLTLSGGVVHKRTAAQTLTDIGGQAALTNPVTGTGTTNYLPKFTGASSIGNSIVFDNGTNVGIGTSSPTMPIANRNGLVIRGGSNGAEFNLQSTSATDGTSVGFALVAFSTDAYYINRLDGNHIWATGSGGNTERMRIWGLSGNVNIGPTPASDAGFKLDVNGTGRFISSVTITRSGTSNSNGLVWSTTGSADWYLGSSPLGNATSDLSLYSYGTNSVVFHVVKSSGNVGIGTSSPNANLHLKSSSGSTIFRIEDSAGVSVGRLQANAGDGNINLFEQSGYALTFGTSNSERMRINSGGYLKASPTGTYTYGASVYTFHSFENNIADWTAGIINNSVSNNYGLLIQYPNNSPNNGDNFFIYCSDSTTQRFRVASNGNVTNTNGSYGSISDVKLKENITDATPKLEELLKVKIRNYNLIGEETKQIGVIAQEIEEIFPGLIDSSIDKDKNGNNLGTTTKSVKYSVFVPMLIKAIQELKQEIDTLKN
jgi:hypothetical protein